MFAAGIGGNVGRYLALAILAGAALGAILTGAYYQAEITTYLRLQAWDPQPPQDLVRRFVALTYARDPAAGELLDPQWVQPVVEKGKLTGLKHMAGMGPETVPVRRIVPASTLKTLTARVRYKAGVYEVAAQFPNGRWALFGADRVREGWRISSIPSSLLKERPQLSD